MGIIYLLIPLSLVLLAAGIWGLLWAVRSNQFEDLVGPAHQILLDDREAQRKAREEREVGKDE